MTAPADWPRPGFRLPVAGQPCLLIPDPEEGEEPLFGIRPGWYTRDQLARLIRERIEDIEALIFIADMLEE